MFSKRKMNFGLRKILSVLLFLIFFSGKAFAIETVDVLGMVNLNCIDLRVIGVCVKPPGIPGIVIMYWEPALLIETVKHPGDAVIESVKSIIADLAAQGTKSLISGVTGLAIPVSSGSSSSKLTGTNLQFNEAHVYEFPFRDQIMAFMDMECPDKLPPGS